MLDFNYCMFAERHLKQKHTRNVCQCNLGLKRKKRDRRGSWGVGQFEAPATAMLLSSGMLWRIRL